MQQPLEIQQPRNNDITATEICMGVLCSVVTIVTIIAICVGLSTIAHLLVTPPSYSYPW